MKIFLVLLMVTASLSLAHAQDVKRPLMIRNLPVSQPLTTLDAKLAELEKRIQQSEEKIHTLQSENLALKEQLNNQNTSIKVIDMAVSEVKETGANHVHYIGNIRVSGFIATKLPGVAQPVQVVTTMGNSSPQYSGKAEAAK